MYRGLFLYVAPRSLVRSDIAWGKDATPCGIGRNGSVHDHMIFHRDTSTTVVMQGVTPCLLADAILWRGTNIICRNKLRSSDTDTELEDDVHPVNRMHSSLVSSALGILPPPQRCHQSDRRLQEPVVRHVDKKTLPLVFLDKPTHTPILEGGSNFFLFSLGTLYKQ
jgi:hypothetical protein